MLKNRGPPNHYPRKGSESTHFSLDKQLSERQNLSVRMGMRRMTRLTNGLSKKWENLEAAYALWFAYYNFCRVHKTLRVTPAMEAGITKSALTIEELLTQAAWE